MTNNVVTQVVAKNWCVGCGMCAAVCPKGRLEIRFNDRGEYSPVELESCAECGIKCSLCYQVCPAHGNTKNETEIGGQLYGDVDGIHQRDETGYYLSSYVGHSNVNGHRENGSSGGMATWTIEKLLVMGEVDAVACVGRTTNPDRLFEFQICRTPDEIRQCGRSAYYPVETSHVIKHIMENEGRFAIIGLPCVCKAIRLAQDTFPQLKKRIKVLAGLVCGRLASKFFAEYLVARGGGDPHCIQHFEFRRKSPNEPAKVSFSRCSFTAGEHENKRFGQVRFSFEWGGGYFKPKGCFYCDDVFAECADVTFMDAWFKPYSDSPEGNNLVLVRNLCIDKIYGDDNLSCSLSPIDIHIVIHSQQRVVFLKRRRIAVYLRHTKSLLNDSPRVRDFLISTIHHPIQYSIERQIMEISDMTAKAWQHTDKNIELFEKELSPLLRRLNRYQFLRQFLSIRFPIIAFQKLSKVISVRLNIKQI